MKEERPGLLGTLPSNLSAECELVLGAQRAAIYDLRSGDVYSINKDARQILLGEEEDRSQFLQKLESMGLVEPSDNPPSEIEIEIPQVGLNFMWLELTDKCNERCLHCYATAGESSSQVDELPVTNWERVIEEGAGLECKKLQFIGGEPLLFKGVFDLATAARDSGYGFIEIFTNGVLLNKENIQKIKALGLHVAVSLYSTVPMVHDSITQVPGSYQKTFRALEMLKEAEIPTRVGIIAMRQNQDTIEKTLRKLDEMEIPHRGADVIRPTGRGGCTNLLPDDKFIRTWALMTGPNFYVDRETFHRNQRWNPCWAGKIAITADGGIIPCIFARNHVVSNVQQQGLEGAINGDELQNLWKITKDDIEGCQECEYRRACHDCRPLAEDTTGNLYAKSPRCTYDPHTGEWGQT